MRVRLTPSWWRDALGGRCDDAVAAMRKHWPDAHIREYVHDLRVAVVFDGERRLCEVADEIARVRAAVRAC